jgi:hypothetical protein
MSTLIVERIDASNFRFQKSFAKLPPTVKKEAQLALGQLMLTDLLDPPAKLHIHTMTNKSAPSTREPSKKIKVCTLHLTSGDTHKASFTYENRTAIMRNCGTHAEIDKNP